MTEFCLQADKQNCYLAIGISHYVQWRMSTLPVSAADTEGLHVNGVTYTRKHSYFFLFVMDTEVDTDGSNKANSKAANCVSPWSFNTPHLKP